MLWVFFLGVTGKIKQCTNEGGASPFFINCCKSEDIEAATAQVEIDPPGKLGWGNSGSPAGAGWGCVSVSSASTVVSVGSTSNET